MSQNPVPNEPTYQEDLAVRAIRHHLPLNAFFELTNDCNLHCTHCYINHRCDNQLEFDEVCDVLDQLAAMGVFRLVLTGGEILLRPDLLDIIEEARRRTFCVTPATNGTLITPELADRLSSMHPLGVAMSLYGAEPITHDRITGVSGSFDRALSALKLLRERDIQVAVSCVVTRENASAEQFEEIRKLVARHGAKFGLISGLIPGRNGCAGVSRSAPSERDLRNAFSSPLMGNPPSKCRCPDGTEVDRPERRGASLCAAGSAILTIAANGDVFPCSNFPLKLGNLRDQSLEEIWSRSPLLKDLRRFRRGDIAECDGCEYFDYCIFCPGIAYGETGSVLSAPPSTCLQARVRCDLAREGALHGAWGPGAHSGT